MTSPINLVQGFQGTINYVLNDNSIDLSKAEIYFNFTDRIKQNRHELLCKQGTLSGEILIPFKKQDSVHSGEFYGEFRITHINGDVDIYPVNGCIILRIREGV